MSITFGVRTGDPARAATPLLVVALATDAAWPKALDALDQRFGRSLSRALRRKDFRGAKDESLLLFAPAAGPERVLLVGMGVGESVPGLTRAATLAGQVTQLTERRLRLAALEPRFQELTLDRDVLAANVRDFTVKEEQSRVAQEMAAQTNDNIRIISRAVPPTKGKSLKKPVLAIALLFALFTALCAGLLRMFLRPGLATPQSAARTLDLPVLGVAPLKLS